MAGGPLNSQIGNGIGSGVSGYKELLAAVDLVSCKIGLVHSELEQKWQPAVSPPTPSEACYPLRVLWSGSQGVDGLNMRCEIFILLASWPHGAGGALTDHPARAWEALLGAGNRAGQVHPDLLGAPAGSKRKASQAEVKAATWLLTTESLPCSLPFWHEGQKYSGCHPEGWCCLDEACTGRGACGDIAPTKLPLQLPRDVPDTGCRLESMGGWFEWDPTSLTETVSNLVFLILQPGQGLSENDTLSLLDVSQQLDVEIVLMSYGVHSEVQQVMDALQSQIQRLLKKISSNRAADVLQKLHLVTQPAHGVPYNSCWLPSVIQAWSSNEEVLAFRDAENKEIVSTASRGTRGDWAMALDERFANRELPLRWAGLLCDEGTETPGLPPAASALEGFVALVARGECSFYKKVQRAQALGAASVIIFSQDDSPILMGCAAPDPCDEALKISAVMVGKKIGDTLLEALFPKDSGPAEVSSRFRLQRRGPSMVGLLGYGGGLWYNSFPGSRGANST